jgi:hypothetical protein
MAEGCIGYDEDYDTHVVRLWLAGRCSRPFWTHSHVCLVSFSKVSMSCFFCLKVLLLDKLFCCPVFFLVVRILLLRVRILFFLFYFIFWLGTLFNIVRYFNGIYLYGINIFH